MILKNTEAVLAFRCYGVKFRAWAFNRFFVFIAFIFITWNDVLSQNLIPNPSFEIYKKCPADLTLRYRTELIPSWRMPTLGTADYFNICAKNQVGVPQNFMGYCIPQDSVAYIGLILLLEPPEFSSKKSLVNYREYIQTKLNSSLVADKKYVVSFYYFIAGYSTYAINRLGIYFSDDPVSGRLSSGVLKYQPQVSIDSTSIQDEYDEWILFKTEYIAKGGENYLTVGNFYDDNHTAFKLRDISGFSQFRKSRILTEQVAYYYIDNVSVVESKETFE